MTTLDAVSGYLARMFRPIPVWAPSAGCKCGRKPAACKGQCLGKVPKDPNWKDRGPFGVGEFAEGDNIALAMGPQPSGAWFVALDVDGPRPVPWTIPETMCTVSGRGKHFIFTVKPFEPLGNWVDVLHDKAQRGGGIDIRYARGAVVVGPSLHQSGKSYMTNTWEPAPLPPAVAHALLAERRRRGLPVERYWKREGKRA